MVLVCWGMDREGREAYDSFFVGISLWNFCVQRWIEGGRGDKLCGGKGHCEVFTWDFYWFFFSLCVM